MVTNFYEQKLKAIELSARVCEGRGDIGQVNGESELISCADKILAWLTQDESTHKQEIDRINSF